MKRLFPFFILTLFALACNNTEKASEEAAEETSESVRSYLQNAHLNGKIKTITETSYTPGEDGSIGEPDSCCVVITQFSEAGFIVTETETTSSGEESSVYNEERNADGKYVSGTVTEGGVQVWKRVVNRDDAGEVINAQDFDTSGQIYRTYALIERNDYDQPVKGQSLDADSTYLGTWSWQYIDGNRVGRGWVDSSGVQLVSRIGEVNDKGWVSKVTDVSIDAESGDTTTVIETYTYDAMDDAGNWTQMTKSKDGKVAQVLKRTYEYYAEEESE
jgi:hypothetical protein